MNDPLIRAGRVWKPRDIERMRAERAERAPMNRMIDEDDDPMMQREENLRTIVKSPSCGKSDRGDG